MTSSMYTIPALLFVFAVFVAFLLVKLPHGYWIKWALIPAVLLLAWYLSIAIPDLMGRAYPGYPPGQFQYLAHSIKKDHSTIEIWTRMPNGSTRLYGVPFDPQVAAQLDLAAEAARQGVPTLGKFKPKGTGGTSGVQSELQIEVRPNPYTLLPPK